MFFGANPEWDLKLDTKIGWQATRGDGVNQIKRRYKLEIYVNFEKWHSSWHVQYVWSILWKCSLTSYRGNLKNIRYCLGYRLAIVSSTKIISTERNRSSSSSRGRIDEYQMAYQIANPNGEHSNSNCKCKPLTRRSSTRGGGTCERTFGPGRERRSSTWGSGSVSACWSAGSRRRGSSATAWTSRIRRPGSSRFSGAAAGGPPLCSCPCTQSRTWDSGSATLYSAPYLLRAKFEYLTNSPN